MLDRRTLFGWLGALFVAPSALKAAPKTGLAAYDLSRPAVMLQPVVTPLRTWPAAAPTLADIDAMLRRTWDSHKIAPEVMYVSPAGRAAIEVAANPPRLDLFGIRRRAAVERLTARYEREARDDLAKLMAGEMEDA